MNKLKKLSLSAILALSTTFLESCPQPPNNPPNNPPTQTQVNGEIDLNNQHHIARFEFEGKTYDFYSNGTNNLGVRIDIHSLPYYLDVYTDSEGNPAYVQHPQGAIARIDYFDEDKAGVTFVSRYGRSFLLEVPRQYVEKSDFEDYLLEDFEKLNRDEICDQIGFVTRNGRLLSKFSGLLKLAGCVISVVGDTATIPSGEAILGCVASYTHGVAITEALASGAEKISSATLGCDFTTTNLPDSIPEEMEQIPHEIPSINLPDQGWIFNSTTGNEYKLSSQGTWQQAENEARANNGHLVAINSEEENNWLINQFADATTNKTMFWIGFSDSRIEGNWEWSNNNQVTYTNWNSGEPNNDHNGEDCGVWFNNNSTFRAGLWNDMSCDNIFQGIIER
jgi:hypothetical protein